MSGSAKLPPYYWTYCAAQHILIVAVSFGLGPRVAAANLLIELGSIEEHTLDWRTAGLEDLIGEIEVSTLLNFGVNRVSIPDFAPTRKVWIDCVDWLRTTLPDDIKGYDLLLREQFFSSVPEYDSAKGGAAKWHSIEPLIRAPMRDKYPDPDLILLSFGGIDTPYSTDVHRRQMPLAFLDGMVGALQQFPSKRVVAFVPPYLAHGEGLHERLEIRSLEREGFANHMQNCGLLICQPGLYTPFEAMQSSVPFALTYPMSFTQAMQGDRFCQLGVECCAASCTMPVPIDALSRDIEAVEASWFADTETVWKKLSGSAVARAATSWINQMFATPPMPIQIPLATPCTTDRAVIVAMLSSQL